MEEDVDLEVDTVPDKTMILNFRHLLEEHNLTEKVFDKTQRCLSDERLLLRGGIVVDATIINLPSSTKNQIRTRDKEMR